MTMQSPQLGQLGNDFGQGNPFDVCPASDVWAKVRAFQDQEGIVPDKTTLMDPADFDAAFDSLREPPSDAEGKLEGNSMAEMVQQVVQQEMELTRSCVARSACFETFPTATSAPDMLKRTARLAARTPRVNPFLQYIDLIPSRVAKKCANLMAKVPSDTSKENQFMPLVLKHFSSKMKNSSQNTAQ